MPEPRSIAFYAFSPQGMALGRTLSNAMEGTLFLPNRLLRAEQTFAAAKPPETTPGSKPAWDGVSERRRLRGFDSLADLMGEQFPHYAAHVFIGAAGIAVRAIAPHLRGKTVDPAVLVCEIHGRFIISLLSGHVGGANALARNLAERTGGQAIITTATDSEGLPALDVLADIAHCRVADPVALKLVTASILAGQTPVLIDPFRFLDLSEEDRGRLFKVSATLPEPRPGGKSTPDQGPCVIVGIHAVSPAPRRLRLFARRLHVGLGYRKDTPAATLLKALRQAMVQAGLAEESLAALATADIKSEDPAIREAARLLAVPLRFYPAEDLARVPVPNPSPKAAEVLECGPLSVAEGSALLSAGYNPDNPDHAPRLVLPKQRPDQGQTGVTVAVAMPVHHENSEFFL